MKKNKCKLDTNKNKKVIKVIVLDSSSNWQSKYSSFANKKINLQKKKFFFCNILFPQRFYQYSKIFNFVGTKCCDTG